MYALRVVDTHNRVNVQCCLFEESSIDKNIYGVSVLKNKLNVQKKYQIYPADTTRRTFDLSTNHVLCLYLEMNEGLVQKICIDHTTLFFPIFSIDCNVQNIYLCRGETLMECHDHMAHCIKKSVY
jgi:hypothetical protein